MTCAARWNHDIHHHDRLLAALPPGCETALDVGCGEGVLARRLRHVVASVCAIDADRESIELARRQDPGGRIDHRLGDFLAEPFEPASFDFIACVAALHHMDEEAALARMRDLLRPGGALGVIGLARSRYPADLPREALAAVANRALRLRHGWWETPAPKTWPPPHTYGEIEQIAARTLPGARFTRHLLWRYSIIWHHADA